MRPVAAGAWGLCSLLSSAAAAPGPDSLLVLANTAAEGSAALAYAYAEARGVPRQRVCLLTTTTDADVTFEAYLSEVEAPLEACLAETGDPEGVDALLLVRGVPMRVSLPDGGRVSMSAILGVADSTLSDSGERLRGMPAGRVLDCGGAPCLGPAWPNPVEAGPFDRAESRTADGVAWRPRLVTWLSGRSDADARGLFERALQAEGGDGAPAPDAEVLFMDGADPARGVLDAQADAVIDQLTRRGVSARRAAFQPDLTGLRLAGFMTGTASLGTTIEGNTFAPGALVDNLTSFGALPQNFAPATAGTGPQPDDAQVSIARWVSQGVTGVHGTTDEPLNGAFPDRALLLDWFDGATLAEAYLGRMPFAYWHNMVVGDPLAAPFAVRPRVSLSVEPLGQVARVALEASDPLARGPVRLRALVDGRATGAAEAAPWTLCVAAHGPPATLTVVGEASARPTRTGRWRSKGWARFEVPGPAIDPAACEVHDAAVADAAVEAPTDAVVDALTDAAPAPNDAAPAPNDAAPAPNDAAPAPDDAAPAPERARSSGCTAIAGRSGGGVAWLALSVCVAVSRRRRSA